MNFPTQTKKIRTYGEEKACGSEARAMLIGLEPRIWRPEYEDANEAEMRLEFESVGARACATGCRCRQMELVLPNAALPGSNSPLDWTTNPLVALYFAVCDEPGQDAAVWILILGDGIEHT